MTGDDASAECRQLLSYFREAFDEADIDNSGELEKHELAVLFKWLFAACGVSRKYKVVINEVQTVLTALFSDSCSLRGAACHGVVRHRWLRHAVIFRGGLDDVRYHAFRLRVRGRSHLSDTYLTLIRHLSDVLQLRAAARLHLLRNEQL